MTIGDIFDCAVTVLIRRWRVAVLGTGVTAMIDATARAVTHSMPLWVAFTIIGVVVDAYVLAVQIQRFAQPVIDRSAVPVWHLSAKAFGRSLQALVACVVLDLVVLGGVALIAVIAYRTWFVAVIPVVLLASSFVPVMLLISSTAFAFVILESTSTRQAFALAWRRISIDLRRSWLLGSATLITVLGSYLFLEFCVRVASRSFDVQWLANATPLLRAPATAYGTALSAVIAGDYLGRYGDRSV